MQCELIRSNMVIPVCSYLEKDYTFVLLDSDISFFEKSVDLEF